MEGLADIFGINWDGLKHGVKLFIPKCGPIAGYNRIDSEFKKNHIYLVPDEELEGIGKEISGHGPEWFNDVLE